MKQQEYEKYRFDHFAEAGEKIFLKESLFRQGELLHNHDFAEITYISEGRGGYFENGASVNVQAGDFLFVSVSDMHRFEPLTRDFAWINCCFRPSVLLQGMDIQHSGADLLQRFDPECMIKPISVKLKDAGKLLKIMLEEYRQKNKGYQEILRAELEALLLKYAFACRRGRNSARSDISREDLIALVSSYYTRGVIIPNAPSETVANQIHISPKYFSTFFKRKVGMTFSEFKKKLRMEQAAIQLLSSDANIGVIMDYCGYTSSKLFYSDFKHRYGMTPAQFRKHPVDVSHVSFLSNITGWVGLPEIWRQTPEGMHALNIDQTVFAVGGTCVNEPCAFKYSVSCSFDGQGFGLLFGIKEFFNASKLQQNYSGIIIDSGKQEVSIIVQGKKAGSRLLLENETVPGFIHELEIEYNPETGFLSWSLNQIQFCRLYTGPEAVTGNVGFAAIKAECMVKTALFKS